MEPLPLLSSSFQLRTIHLSRLNRLTGLNRQTWTASDTLSTVLLSSCLCFPPAGLLHSNAYTAATTSLSSNSSSSSSSSSSNMSSFPSSWINHCFLHFSNASLLLAPSYSFP